MFGMFLVLCPCRSFLLFPTIFYVSACNFWIGVRPHLTCVCVNRPVTEYPRPESDYADEYLKKGHPDRFFWSCFSLDDFKDYVVPTEGP